MYFVFHYSNRTGERLVTGNCFDQAKAIDVARGLAQYAARYSYASHDASSEYQVRFVNIVTHAYGVREEKTLLDCRQARAIEESIVGTLASAAE